MPQTTMTADPSALKPGEATEDSDFKQDISAVVEEADGFPPGVFVVRGTADRRAKLPAVAPTVNTLLGVSLFSHKARSDGSLTGNENYEIHDTAPVRRKGPIGMIVEDAFTAGAQVFCRFAAGAGGSQLGAARTDADTATAAAVVGAYFRTSGDAGDIGVIDLCLGAS